MELAPVRPAWASRMPKIRRGLLVAITVLATALGTAACGPSHHHPKKNTCCSGY